MQKEFMCTWRIWQYGVICGTQNLLRMRRKNLNTFEEYMERIYPDYQYMALGVFQVMKAGGYRDVSKGV